MGKEATTRVRRRERKNIASGIAHVNSSFNNTTITITAAAPSPSRSYVRDHDLLELVELDVLDDGLLHAQQDAP